MKTDNKKKKEIEISIESEEKKDFYLNEEAKEWEFSDYVRVSAGPRGMVFSFGKFIREDEKYGIFKEILLPFDVAESLANVIQKQFSILIEQGKIEKIEKKEKE